MPPKEMMELFLQFLFRKQPNQVTGALGADGEGANNDVLFFKTDIPIMQDSYKKIEMRKALSL